MFISSVFFTCSILILFKASCPPFTISHHGPVVPDHGKLLRLVFFQYGKEYSIYIMKRDDNSQIIKYGNE